VNTLNRQPPKASKKRIMHGEEEAHLVDMACSEPPEGHCRWTVRLLAKMIADWQFTTADARVKLRRLYPSI
jgi:hypothetical protein